MYMHNLLMAMLFTVDYQSVAIFADALVTGEFGCDGEHSAESRFVIRLDVIHGRYPFIRDYQDMGWHGWRDITKGGNQIVVVERIRGYFAADDFAENGLFVSGELAH